MPDLGKTKPDKIHKEFETLALLQTHIAAAGAKYDWGSKFTVYNDGANNGDYKLTYGEVDTDKTNSSNLVLTPVAISSSANENEILKGAANGNAQGSGLYEDGGIQLRGKDLIQSQSLANTYRRNWKTVLGYNLTGSSGNADFNLFASDTIPDAVATVKVMVQGVKPDGTEGYSAILAASFRKDGTADMVQIGTTTTIHEVNDSANSPAATISINSDNLRVSYDSGDAGTSYDWSIFLDIYYTVN